MSAFDQQVEAGQYDPPMPGEEGSNNSFAVETLGQALGFINEFNHNVQIFEPLATLFVLAVIQFSATNGVVNRHSGQIARIQSDITALRRMIDAVGSAARTEAEYEAEVRASHNRGYTSRGR